MSQHAEEHTAYEIQVQGHLDPGWADWFAGFTISTPASPPMALS